MSGIPFLTLMVFLPQPPELYERTGPYVTIKISRMDRIPKLRHKSKVKSADPLYHITLSRALSVIVRYRLKLLRD